MLRTFFERANGGRSRVILASALLCSMVGGSAVVAQASTAGAQPADSVYVSPSGSNGNPGTQSRPVKTLARAQEIVNAAKGKVHGNITVYLAGGTYRLTRSWDLTAADSGAGEHSINWTADPGQDPVVSGAQPVTGWARDGSSPIWSAKVASGLDTRQLYVDGQRATLASGPAPVRLTPTSTGYKASSNAMAHWRNPSQIDFVYTTQIGLMVEPICPVKSIHGATITMQQPCWDNSTMRTHDIVGFGAVGSPTYIENAYELLSKPGQFYLDRTRHVIYYYPRSGQNLKRDDVEVPVVQTLIHGNGVHNVAFSNIEFGYATWLAPGTPNGFSDVQDGLTLVGKGAYTTVSPCSAGATRCRFGDWTEEAAAVTFSHDSSITFQRDEFVHLGAAGLDLDEGSVNDVVSGCVFTDISGNGLEVGSNTVTASGSDATTGTAITNNHLYGLPVEFHGGVAIWVGYAAHTLISHNQIDHVSYSGVSIGWGGWLDKVGRAPIANYSTDNVISDNLIFDFMEELSDGGGVYTLGLTGDSMKTGEKVTGNVIYNQMAWGRALQSDDGATYVTYTRNVLYDDNYDWGTNHVDYRYHDGRDAATVVTHNYWQQGDPKSTPKGVTINGNTLISDAESAPSSIVKSAGIVPAYASILKWAPSGFDYPIAPDRVQPLYAYGGKAYVTWRPSYAYGFRAVSGYTVTACPDASSLPVSGCGASGHSISISSADFQSRGYVVIPGLKIGSKYSFTVVANSAAGNSTPSIPSPTTDESSKAPSKPLAPGSLNVLAGSHIARLIWYAPRGASTNAVLAYRVTQSGGSSHTVGGLRPLIVANTGGRVVDVVSGLRPGHSYTFSVSAINPAGQGPSASFPSVTPTS